MELLYYEYVGLSANETVGEDTGEIVDPARPDDDEEDDNADGRGDFIMLVLLNSFGGGLTIICASGVQKVVNF